MFDFFEGTLESIEKEGITVAVHGIGYRIMLGKASPIRSLPLQSPLRVWVEQIIREDKHELYGFHSIDERRLFCLLKEVSGIGPKAALTISNAAERNALIQAIANKDPLPLQTIPGIGKKLAERIVVELHEKIAKTLSTDSSKEPGSPEKDSLSKAHLALKTLGFREEEAKERLKKVMQDKNAPKTFEELIQRALKIDNTQ